MSSDDDDKKRMNTMSMFILPSPGEKLPQDKQLEMIKLMIRQFQSMIAFIQAYGIHFSASYMFFVNGQVEEGGNTLPVLFRRGENRLNVKTDEECIAAQDMLVTMMRNIQNVMMERHFPPESDVTDRDSEEYKRMTKENIGDPEGDC